MPILQPNPKQASNTEKDMLTTLSSNQRETRLTFGQKKKKKHFSKVIEKQEQNGHKFVR